LSKILLQRVYFSWFPDVVTLRCLATRVT